jgi:hypothetical protein
VNRQVGLRVGGQPQVREVEVVEVCGDWSSDATRIEASGDGGWALGRNKAACQSGGGDQNDGENKYEPVASPALPTARSWVTA